MTAAPGPYTVDKQDGEDEDSASYILSNAQDGPFCSVEIEAPAAERDATAHLLAAAWQLREALRAAVDSQTLPEKLRQAVDLASAALDAANEEVVS